MSLWAWTRPWAACFWPVSPLSECVLYTSGRVPMDMVRKAIRAGVPTLVSKTMPTVQSLELAAEYGLQLLCGRKHPLTSSKKCGGDIGSR